MTPRGRKIDTGVVGWSLPECLPSPSDGCYIVYYDRMTAAVHVDTLICMIILEMTNYNGAVINVSSMKLTIPVIVYSHSRSQQQLHKLESCTLNIVLSCRHMRL